MNQDIDQRLAELEVRLTFIDDTVQGLADADADRSQRIAALERLVRELRSELASVRAGGGVGDAQSEPPPPHY